MCIYLTKKIFIAISSTFTGLGKFDTVYMKINLNSVKHPINIIAIPIITVSFLSLALDTVSAEKGVAIIAPRHIETVRIQFCMPTVNRYPESPITQTKASEIDVTLIAAFGSTPLNN